MPKHHVSDHVRAASTCNSILSCLMVYPARDGAIETLERRIRVDRVAALLAAQREVRDTPRPVAPTGHGPPVVDAPEGVSDVAFPAAQSCGRTCRPTRRSSRRRAGLRSPGRVRPRDRAARSLPGRPATAAAASRTRRRAPSPSHFGRSSAVGGLPLADGSASSLPPHRLREHSAPQRPGAGRQHGA